MDNWSGWNFRIRETGAVEFLPANSPRQAVVDLGIDVTKVIGRGPDPVAVIVGYLEQHGADLIVLATHHRGQIGCTSRSRASGAASEMTLFLPEGVRGFASQTDGSVSLSNILILIAASPQPEPAISGAAVLVRQLQCKRKDHVASRRRARAGNTDTGSSRMVVAEMTKQGDVIDMILRPREVNADLMVIPPTGETVSWMRSEGVMRARPSAVALSSPCDSRSSYVSASLSGVIRAYPALWERMSACVGVWAHLSILSDPLRQPESFRATALVNACSSTKPYFQHFRELSVERSETSLTIFFWSSVSPK
jgi:hypothetical protein